MPLKATFIITIESGNYEHIKNGLKANNLKVNKQRGNPHPTQVFCKKKLKTEEEINRILEVIRHIDGVTNVERGTIDDAGVIMDKVVPILVSSIITFGGILFALITVHAEIPWYEYLIHSGWPSLLSALIQYILRRKPNEPHVV